MKIDFYISSLSGGGAEKVLVTLATVLSNRGHDVTICSLEKRQQFYDVDSKIHIKRIKSSYGGILGAFEDYSAIKHNMRLSKADVVVSFLLRCNILTLLAAVGSSQKIIVSDRNNPVKEHSKMIFLFQNILYLFADKVIVQTEQIKQYYASFLQKKIDVIENPLDICKLNSEVILTPKREKTICSIGRLENQKDFETLIIAFSKIHIKYPEWKLNIWGSGINKEKLQKLIDKLQLNESAFLCGKTTTPFLELRKASIFVLSSFYEGFPNVLCEAMLAGNLCISSDCISGPRELIDEGKNGWLFRVGDVHELEKKIEYCIENEANLNSIRENAKHTVNRLDTNLIVDKWENKLVEVGKV